ncbi:hypothetical protein [Paenibacillus popilliae]|uniref:3-hydroxyisobutyrate dehydrogenase n=1 Tax=Paenibacillus popilliae ATCC 14706 TaxID=1212764 RepID=M9M307_PAEPP|nr:hypothetical protein [Paenibacillus popilliae]GAC43389.1 3-hydroxyisobutyrate dehydrogenase [Paenibacillus popilliae ATCC 14706]
MQQLFQSMFVLPSAAKGLLGDTNAFRVIGDGSPVETEARSYGKFLCDCRKSGNWKCSCKRQFSDPDADWGWDSCREKYYFGRYALHVRGSRQFLQSTRIPAIVPR